MLTIYDGGGNFLPFESWNFSGGEVFFRLKKPHGSGPVKIKAQLRSSNDVMELLMATDALRRRGFQDIDLTCPYVPYARQDRVCNDGEALSIKVFCDLINSQGYRSVEIWDAHSDIAPALLDRCVNVEQYKFVSQIPDIRGRLLIVAPDAGAYKKAFKCAQVKGVFFVAANKVRDTSTGEITNTEIGTSDSQNCEEILIVDDICDGGRTFIELAKEIHRQVTLPVKLYVTHGIFSKGLDVLKPYIDHVYTANIWPDLYKGNEDYVTVLSR